MSDSVTFRGGFQNDAPSAVCDPKHDVTKQSESPENTDQVISAGRRVLLGVGERQQAG